MPACALSPLSAVFPAGKQRFGLEPGRVGPGTRYPMADAARAQPRPRRVWRDTRVAADPFRKPAAYTRYTRYAECVRAPVRAVLRPIRATFRHPDIKQRHATVTDGGRARRVERDGPSGTREPDSMEWISTAGAAIAGQGTRPSLGQADATAARNPCANATPASPARSSGVNPVWFAHGSPREPGALSGGSGGFSRLEDRTGDSAQASENDRDPGPYALTWHVK